MLYPNLQHIAQYLCDNTSPLTKKTKIQKGFATIATSLARYHSENYLNTNQRAANGGLDPSWLDLAFFGAPRFFRPEVPKSFNNWFLGDLWTENRGAPKTPNPTTTDPTPHLRPSELKPLRRVSKGRGDELHVGGGQSCKELRLGCRFLVDDGISAARASACTARIAGVEATVSDSL